MRIFTTNTNFHLALFVKKFTSVSYITVIRK